MENMHIEIRVLRLMILPLCVYMYKFSFGRKEQRLKIEGPDFRNIGNTKIYIPNCKISLLSFHMCI